ncbi:THAP domain-containing protein 5-like isoform 2-T2 [Pholidichthys leucotaenia]
MRREEWTPSRHQYLCSEHFTEDCFDIRWGIRYLKNTAIPTIFPPSEDDGDKKTTTIKSNPEAKSSTSGADTELIGFDPPPSKRPLIFSTTSKKVEPSTVNSIITEHTDILFELPLVSESGTPDYLDLSDIQTAACEKQDDSGTPTLSLCNEPHSGEQTSSTVAVLCCESGVLCDGESPLEELGQSFSIVPIGLVEGKLIGCLLEERGTTNGEHISVYEHSYCRPDTDKEQLWSKLVSLHAKILELDQREENTVAKIHALEKELALLKRDAAVFKAKKKVLEDCISSVLL